MLPWLPIVFLALVTLQFFLVSRSVNALYRLLAFFLPHPLPYVAIAILFFPGTVVHEFAHFATAAVLFLPLGGIHFLPSWNHGSLTLGYVTYGRKDFVRGFLVGAAPLPTGLGTLWVLFTNYTWFASSWWGLLLVGYLTFAITSTMFYSASDMKDAGAFTLLAVLLYGLLRLVGIAPEAYLAGAAGGLGIAALASSVLIGISVFLGISAVIHLTLIAVGRMVLGS
ncbi:MAG: hypothetical protein N2691_02830 [Patescibacteria group bacterium]|nr:hypothetical protein [Patescibacteria group bacterium]